MAWTGLDPLASALPAWHGYRGTSLGAAAPRPRSQCVLAGLSVGPQAKTKELKSSFNDQFSAVHELCLMVLNASQKPDLIRATLSTLHAFLSWVPLGYIFESNVIEVGGRAARDRRMFFPVRAPAAGSRSGIDRKAAGGAGQQAVSRSAGVWAACGEQPGRCQCGEARTAGAAGRALRVPRSALGFASSHSHSLEGKGTHRHGCCGSFVPPLAGAVTAVPPAGFQEHLAAVLGRGGPAAGDATARAATAGTSLSAVLHMIHGTWHRRGS